MHQPQAASNGSSGGASSTASPSESPVGTAAVQQSSKGSRLGSARLAWNRRSFSSRQAAPASKGEASLRMPGRVWSGVHTVRRLLRSSSLAQLHGTSPSRNAPSSHVADTACAADAADSSQHQQVCFCLLQWRMTYGCWFWRVDVLCFAYYGHGRDCSTLRAASGKSRINLCPFVPSCCAGMQAQPGASVPQVSPAAHMHAPVARPKPGGPPAEETQHQFRVSCQP